MTGFGWSAEAKDKVAVNNPSDFIVFRFTLDHPTLDNLIQV
jgi:hypothetical protein